MNKNRIFSWCCACLIVCSCATIPERIDQSLLVEATADQSAQLKQIDLNIIQKRDERIAADKAIAESQALLAAQKELIKEYKDKRKILESQPSQDAKEKIEETDNNIEVEKMHNEYLSVFIDQLNVDRDYCSLELTSLLAKADLVKANIAFEYQKKHQDAKQIRVEPYQKYYDDTLKQLSEKAKDKENAAQKTASMKKLIGYGDKK